jgi:hypothetical protein
MQPKTAWAYDEMMRERLHTSTSDVATSFHATVVAVDAYEPGGTAIVALHHPHEWIRTTVRSSTRFYEAVMGRTELLRADVTYTYLWRGHRR